MSLRNSPHNFILYSVVKMGIFCILVFIIMRDLIRQILIQETRVKWTKEKVLELASQFNQMNHFKKAHPQAYQAAGRNGWLEDIRQFMKPKYKTWTKEDAHIEALKYQHPDQFQTNSNQAYQAASYHGWLPDITSHMTTVQNKWTNESIWETALKYETKRDFIKNDYGAYQAATARGILDDVTGHMRILGDMLHRYIYVYEFPDNSVYVGLSFDTKERDKRHRSKEKSQVFKHIQNTGLSPDFKVLTERPIPAKDAQIMEDETIKTYRENGWTVLNIAKAGGLGSTVLEKLTKEDILKIALQYTTKTKFCKEQQRACTIAKRMGWYEEATKHMEVKNIMWTMDMLRDEALKYNTRNEFRHGSPNAYKAASSRGILDDITKHMGDHKKNQFATGWTKERAREEINKHASLADIRKNNAGLYKAILKYKWHDLIPDSFRVNKITWTKDMIQNEISKYNTLKDFRKSSPKAYDAALRNGWLEELTKELTRSRETWSYEKILNSARPYNSRTEFRVGNSKAYHMAYYTGIMDDIANELGW